MRTALTLSAALFTSLWLVACGDSPAGMPPPPDTSANEVPASATVSDAAYVSYTGSLPASETQEPLDVNKMTPPTSESDEPALI
jgi:hypothetical protein